MRKSWLVRVCWLGLSVAVARADVTLLVEEPYGAFGGMTPTGHAAVYFSRICAETPTLVRRCRPGEIGAVISRYHRVGGYDWIAIPLIPYLYAVDRPDQVPTSISLPDAELLRDGYRRAHLEGIVADLSDGGTPHGDWTQLVGEAYNRAMYAFVLESSTEQDDRMIALLNSRPNRVRFHLLSRNCADFARQVIDFYYPHAVHRDFSSDLGVMTPKQAAQCVVQYSKRHPHVPVSSFAIAQVPGTVPRSRPLRGVLESLLKSKRYVVPLAPLAILHPAVGGGLALAWVEGSHFNPKRVADSDGGLAVTPQMVMNDLRLTGEGLSRIP